MRKVLIVIACLGAIGFTFFGQSELKVGSVMGCYELQQGLFEADPVDGSKRAVLIPGYVGGVPRTIQELDKFHEGSVYRNITVLSSGSIISVDRIYWQRRLFDSVLQIRGSTPAGADRDLRALFRQEWQDQKLVIIPREVLRKCP